MESRTFESKAYTIFELFQKEWAIITAGTMENFNGCTVSWGTLGTLWTRPGKTGSIVTVYLYPTRYTQQFFKDHDTFTVSFFPATEKKALAYMGSHSGRDEDKVAAAGLTPVPFGGSVTYEEAKTTFLCRKIYQHQLTKEDLAEDIQAYYADNPQAYPVDEQGDWHPHWMFIGEIMDVKETR